jgi:hypothetical protein
MIHIGPSATTFGTHCFGLRVYPYAVHGRQINDQAIVYRTQARAIMPTATNGDFEAVVAAKVDGAYNIGDITTLGNEVRPFVNHGVIQSPCRVISSILAANDIAAYPSAKRTYLICCY